MSESANMLGAVLLKEVVAELGAKATIGVPIRPGEELSEEMGDAVRQGDESGLELSRMVWARLWAGRLPPLGKTPWGDSCTPFPRLG